MNGTQEERATASGYARGAFDASFKLTHCAPHNFQLSLLMDYTRWMLENNPAELEKPADMLIGVGLMKQWPCKGDGCNCKDTLQQKLTI